MSGKIKFDSNFTSIRYIPRPAEDIIGYEFSLELRLNFNKKEKDKFLKLLDKHVSKIKKADSDIKCPKIRLEFEDERR